MTPATCLTVAIARRRCAVSATSKLKRTVREVAAALRAHRGDVDALARERFADVRSSPWRSEAVTRTSTG